MGLCIPSSLPSTLQLNARFSYLSTGRCPNYDDSTQASNCWSHPGSYFASLGFLTAKGDRLTIDAGDWKNGFSRIVLNGQTLTIANLTHPTQHSGFDLQVTLIDAHHLTLTTASSLWSFAIDSSDRFLNLAKVQVSDWHRLVSEVRPHGLLGQTWNRAHGKKKSGQEVDYVEGQVDDYSEAGNDLMGCGTQYNLFHC